VFVTTRAAELLTLLFFFFHFEHFAPFVKTTIGANSVRQAHGSAIGASNQIPCLQSIMSAPAITATF
jgi:hypothetical protein